MLKKMRQKLMAATIATCMGCTSLGGFIYADTQDLTYWVGDGLTRYSDVQAAPGVIAKEIRLKAARNEYETGQVILKSDTQGFTINNVQLPTLTNGEQTIDGVNLSYNFALYRMDMLTDTAGQWGEHGKPLYPYSGIPDPLSNDKQIEVEKGKNQPVYIKAYIPEDTVPGIYTGTAVVETTMGDIQVPIEIEVFGATVPQLKDAGFTFYNWMSDIVQGYYTEWNVFETYYKVEDVIRTPEGLDFSQDFYEIINNWAESMVDHRQNSVLIHTVAMLDAADTTIDETGTYNFDWTLFDKYIDMWLSNGMTSIANIHYGYHQKDVMLKDDGNGNAIFTWEPYSTGNGLDKEKDNWYKQYLPALAEHIENYDITKYPQFAGTDKETLFDIWAQQLYDEPTATNLWVYYAQLTREHLVVKNEAGEVTKNVKIFDADMTGATRNKPYTDYTDIQVPQLKFIPGNESSYHNLQERGQDFWVYVCVSPTKPWLNRFVGQPDTTYPMLFWYEAQINATGYLHWAFNVWNIGYADDGDCYMVYPDVPNNDILSSIRYEGQRDGVEDWELFQLAKQTDAQKTQEILDKAVSHPNGSYVQDTEDYRKLREAMLELASGNAEVEVPNVGVPGSIVAPEPPLGAYYVDNRDEAIKYNNMQVYSHASENESYRKSVHYQNYTGEVGSYGGSAELDFTGTGIEIMSEQRSNKGDILVELYKVLEDGTTEEIDRTVVSCFSTNVKPFYFPYKKTGLEYGDYRIRMTNIRTQNGTSATQMVLDAFMVHTLEEDGTTGIAKVDLLASDKGTLVATSEGKIIQSGEIVQKGKEVTITAEPQAGYYCKALNINGMQYPVTNNVYTIEAIDKDIIVAAVFEKTSGEVIPAENVALGRPVTASSVDAANGYLAEYVVNGNTETTSKLAWSNDATVNNYRTSDLWVEVELDKVTAIDTVNLYWNGWGTTYVAKNYEIQVSTTGEEGSYQTVATQNNHVNGKSEFVFEEVDAKYVRIWMPKNPAAGHTAVLLHEFEVMSAPQTIPEEVDKTALVALIEEVQGMDTSIYTEASVEALNRVLQAAILCNTNAQATAEEVAEAINALNAAVEALETKGVVENVALGRPVTASSVDTGNGYSAADVVDGDKQTVSKPAWSNDANVNSIHTSDLWLQVELNELTVIDAVNLYWNSWTGMELAPKTYEVQVSTTGEEGSYQTVVTQETQIRGKAEHTFNPINAKYVRIWVPQDATLGHNAVCLHEVEIMNSLETLERTAFYTVGAETVGAGEEYELGVGIRAEAQNVYAQETYVTYDKALIEYVGCEELNDTVEVVVDSETTEGVLRILTVTPDGKDYSDKVLMNLKFKVKESAKDHTKMQISGCVGIIEESNGVTSKSEVLEGKEHNISIRNEVLPENRLDVNKDGVIDVADLALVAYYYHAKANTPGWEIAKCADVNNDEEVNIIDLSFVANKILGK